MVKRKIRLMVSLSIMLMILGWLMTVVIVITGNAQRQQNILLEQAQSFMNDKLYMRAIGRYQQAVDEYVTDRNPEIEQTILGVYKEAGKYNDYYKLIEDRISDSKATQEEYVELAQTYIDSGAISKAMDILKSGLEQYDSEQLSELFEEIRYEVKNSSLDVVEVMQPTRSWITPYRVDDKWGYVNSAGKNVLDAGYEEAFPFLEESNYTVVKLDGVYTLIDMNGDWYAIDKSGLDKVTGVAPNAIVGCRNGKYSLYTITFVPLIQDEYEDALISSNNLCFVKKNGKWGLINTSGEQIADYIYDEVVLNSHGEAFANGYAVVKDSDGYFIINEEGNELGTYRYANAKGMEGSLIAVADSNGRWGFTNGAEETVIDYQYEDAYSMSDSVAAVKKDGQWGYISKKNKMVIEAQYEEALPFVKGEAIVKKMGQYETVTLEYYDYF